MTAVFAHRGCTEGFTENTLEAFVEARRLGADGVELDVRLTADGALAIHHDAEIPGLGAIAELEVADLPAHVPLLADVLAVCEGMVVNVEIKNAPQDPGWDPGEAVAALTAAAIEEAGWTDAGASCPPSRWRRCGRSRPPTAAWPSAPCGASAPRPEPALAAAAEAGFGAVHPFVLSVDTELVGAGACNGPCRQRLDGQRPEDLRAMVAAGVDTVITDRLGEALVIAGWAGGRRAAGA